MSLPPLLTSPREQTHHLGGTKQAGLILRNLLYRTRNFKFDERKDDKITLRLYRLQYSQFMQ